MRDSEYCLNHDPTRVEENKRRGSRGGRRGGRGRPQLEVKQVKEQLREFADRVLDGSLDRADAAILNQILGTYLRAISLDLKIVEQTELIPRLEAMEELLQESRRGRPYGA
jgi:alpha-D-ribose 1-methylphosphonate 5-triphosphate synthase subunit PhnI